MKRIVSALCAMALIYSHAGAQVQINGQWGEERDGWQIRLVATSPHLEPRFGEYLHFRVALKNCSNESRTIALKRPGTWMVIRGADNTVGLSASPGAAQDTTIKPGETYLEDGPQLRIGEMELPGKLTGMCVRLESGKYKFTCSTPFYVQDKEDANRATGLRANPGEFKIQIHSTPLAVVAPGLDDKGILWGPLVSGMQIGLRTPVLKSSEGQTALWTSEVVIRNLNSRLMEVEMPQTPDYDWSPSFTNAAGEYVHASSVWMSGLRIMHNVKLPTRAVISLGPVAWTAQTGAPGNGEAGAAQPPVLTAPAGKYNIEVYHTARFGDMYISFQSGKQKFTIGGAN